jgi:hypothetical protein
MMQKKNNGGNVGKIYDHVDPVIRWNTGQETSGIYRTGECDGMSIIRRRSSRNNRDILRKQRWRLNETRMVS